MKPVYFIIYSLFISFTFIQCRKEPGPSNELPPVTQEGKNTFGCKINGEVWVPYYKCGFGSNPCGEFFADVYPSNTLAKLPVELNLSFGRKDGTDPVESFQINTKQGCNLSTLGNKIDSITFRYLKKDGRLYYNYNYFNKPEIFEITRLDTLQNIISGIFNLTLYASMTDSIEVTEGRFDLGFKTCKCFN